ncbi:MAG TPA: GAF domain-containing protein [Ktedonobacteraceae bacterium]|nr:GAF domain-containing protein [Ktedonobacteraceae bacterium]
MKSVETWRLYLDEIVRRRTAPEKQHLYAAVGVSRTTFQRWRSGENIPDAAHVYVLMNTLMEEERDHLHALMLEDPKVRSLLPMEAAFVEGRLADRIPLEVYEEVLRIGRDTPDRFWLLCSTILSHALSQLETHPTLTGIELVVACCMPPREDGKVRSMRAYASLGTPPWRRDLHAQDTFLGAESLGGYVVMRRHGIMVPDTCEKALLAPIHSMEHELSCAAFPIMREGCIAGALIVSSAASHFFSQEKLTLIEKYADLIRLAFYDHAFYPSAVIDLALMPPWYVQKQYFSTFRQEVNEEYKRRIRELSQEELTQVEERVRVQFEGELLGIAARLPDGELLGAAESHRADLS